MVEQNNISSKLNESAKGNPFSVPDNYFDGLPAQIHQRKRGTLGSRQGLSVKVLLNQLALVVGFAILFTFAKLLLSVPTVNVSEGNERVATSGNIAGNTEKLNEQDGRDNEDYIISYLIDQNISDADIAYLIDE